MNTDLPQKAPTVLSRFMIVILEMGKGILKTLRLHRSKYMGTGIFIIVIVNKGNVCQDIVATITSETVCLFCTISKKDLVAKENVVWQW